MKPGFFAPNAPAGRGRFAHVLPIPQGLGISVHWFTEANLDAVAASGLKIIRFDMTWSDIERQAGVYRWGENDRIIARLRKRNLTPLIILDYNNPEIYGGKFQDAIRKPEEAEGFARFAAAAVRHYRDANALWEIYNEPNQPDFWVPTPNASEYIIVARKAIAAIRQADKDAVIFAPALGHDPATGKPGYGYLEECFKGGLLENIDAVSIHPYPDGQPEEAIPMYDKVRDLVARYGRGKKKIPIVSSEWGYTSTRRNVQDPKIHADFIERMLLLNQTEGIPVSIIYQLNDRSTGGADDSENHYGILQADGSPKEAFKRVKNLTARLRGKRFVRRAAAAPTDFILEFSDGRATTTAAWTTDAPHSVTRNGRAIALSGTPIHREESKS